MNKIDTDIFNKAVALAQAGDKAEAYAQLESIYHFNPTDMNLLLWLAFTTSNLNEAEGRIALAEKLEPTNQNLASAKNWLAQEKAKQRPLSVGAPAITNVNLLDLFHNLSGKGLNSPDLVIFNEGLDLANLGKTQEAYKKLIPLLSRNKDNVDLILAIALTNPNLDSAETLVNRAKAIAGQSQAIQNAQDYIAQQKQKNNNSTTANPNASSSSASIPANNIASTYPPTPLPPIQASPTQSGLPPFQTGNALVTKSQPSQGSVGTQVQAGQIYPANSTATTHVHYHVPQVGQPAIFCRNCRKDDMFQKVSAIYSAGVTTTRSSSIYFDTNADFGSINGKSVSSSLLADALQPPQPPPLWWWFPLCLLGIGIPMLVFGAVGVFICVALSVAAVISIPLIIRYYKNAMEQFREDSVKWDRSYYCFRCDGITVV